MVANWGEKVKRFLSCMRNLLKNRGFLWYSHIHSAWVPKWTNGTDCRSVGLRLRGFESLPTHKTKERGAYALRYSCFIARRGGIRTGCERATRRGRSRDEEASDKKSERASSFLQPRTSVNFSVGKSLRARNPSPRTKRKIRPLADFSYGDLFRQELRDKCFFPRHLAHFRAGHFCFDIYRKRAVLHRDRRDSPLHHARRNHERSDGTQNLCLNETLQRPRAVLWVVALFCERFKHIIADDELYVFFREPLLYFPYLDFNDAPYRLGRERVEDNDVVKAVQELRTELGAQTFHHPGFKIRDRLSLASRAETNFFHAVQEL